MAITIDQFLRDLTERELLSTEDAQTVRRQLSANVPEPALKAGAESAPAGSSASLVLCDCLVQGKLRDDEHQLIYGAQRLRDDSAVTIHLLMPSGGTPRLNGSPASAVELSSRPRGITDVARHGAMVFVCCESLEAETLEQVILQNGALPLELATETLLQTARTLHRLSEQGFSLPEISADLLLLDEDGQVHVTGNHPAESLRSAVQHWTEPQPPAKRMYESLGKLYAFLLSGRGGKSESPAVIEFDDSLKAGENDPDPGLAQFARRVYARLIRRDDASPYRGWSELIEDLQRLLRDQALPIASSAPPAEISPAGKAPARAVNAETSRGMKGWIITALAIAGAAALALVWNALK